MDPALYPNATFPDEETLKVGLGFLRKASAQRNASGTPFWLGVGFVKPHLPNADAFAKESLVFDRAFVQQAVCG